MTCKFNLQLCLRSMTTLKFTRASIDRKIKLFLQGLNDVLLSRYCAREFSYSQLIFMLLEAAGRP